MGGSARGLAACKGVARKAVSVLMSLVLAVAFVPAAGLVAQPEEAWAATFSDINRSSVWLRQNVQGANGTCTLCSAAMMLRRAAMMNGDTAWSTITENAIKSTAWAPGLRWSFKYRGLSVAKGDLPGGASNTNRLITILKNHQEGIVLYNGAHAVLLTDYTNGVFYCCDPILKTKTPITKATGNVRVTNSYKYWYVSSYVKSLNNNPTPTVATPSINTKDIIGGKQVSLATSTGGATIRYTVDGKTNPSASVGTVYKGAFNDTWAVMGVRAIGTKGGYNPSAIKGLTINTSQVATPSINISNTPSSAVARITSSTGGSTIYYTTNGSNPTTSSARYTGDVKLTQSAIVKAIAVKAGMRNSGIASKSVTCSVPGQPTVTAKTSKIAVNDALDLSWKADSAAANYDVKLYKDGAQVKSVNTQGAVASFALTEVGEYEIGVTANNYYGASKESERIKVEAMADCKVRFVDEHAEDESLGTEVLNEQVVRYGYSATKPASPAKRGYSFAGWDGSFGNITEDVVIKSTWDINKYTVRFYAEDGTTQLSRQMVKYLHAADVPEAPAPNMGYVFDGWQVMDADDDSARDYNKVDSDMKLRAVYSWADKELPNVAQITSATRTAEGIYNVGVKIANYPYETTTSLLRVALKTKSGKLVQTARETVSIAQGATVERTVTLKYTGDHIATVAEVELVGIDGNYRTGGAYSKAVTADIVTGDGFSYDAWSEWSTVKPMASDTVQVEEGTQYRYRDKQTTTSTATSLDGWTRDGTQSTSYGAWGSAMTTTTKPTASDTLQIVSSWISKYNYYHWHSKYDNCMNQDSCWVNNTSVKHTYSTSSALSGPKYVFADKGGKASQEYGPGGTCAWKPSKAYWWLESTVTTYKYQTRSKTINYGYYKWDDNSWSEWSNNSVTASSSRQVETRSVWRYRTKQNTAGTEDASGTQYDISGKLKVESDLAGKEATVMVYNATNTDPNEDQLQYIGQITIGKDNAYNFSFVPKKELAAESGDLIVALGIKGATGLVNVDVIKAPRAKHTVKFQYQDAGGQTVIVNEQEVVEGENAVIPASPQRAGYRFAGWDDSAQRINADLTVTRNSCQKRIPSHGSTGRVTISCCRHTATAMSLLRPRASSLLTA